MPQEIDKFGFPLDPELRRLEDSLEYLAAAWRTDRLEKDAEEYRQTLAYIYNLGWDGSLEVQSELPDDMMPDMYVNRHQRWGDKSKTVNYTILPTTKPTKLLQYLRVSKLFMAHKTWD